MSEKPLEGTMLAAVYQDVEDIKVQRVPVPELPTGGLVIRVRACALCGSDLRNYRHGSSHLQPPWIIGHEIAGEVVQVDQDLATSYEVGSRVAVANAVPCGHCVPCQRGWLNMCDDVKAHGFHYPGGLAEYMAVQPEAVLAGAVHHIPTHVSFEEASVTEPLACALNGQEQVEVGFGDTVVVIGAGPVGCLHVELARIRGASSVMLVERNSARLEQAAQVLDADHYIDAAAQDAVEAVLRATGGRGADVVIVACDSAQADALRMAAVRGRVSFFGGRPKTEPTVRIDANLLHYRELRVVGAFTSSPMQNRAALGLIASHRVRVKSLISAVLPLPKLIDGLHMIENGSVLKVVITP